MTHIYGIDHGNGNLKTEHLQFPCGFKMEETKPSAVFAKDIIEYKGKFYSLTSNRFPYSTDKTTNENSIIFTLFGIAKETVRRAEMRKTDFDFKRDFSGFIGADVILAVGLPPAHFEKQAKAFKKYFMDEFRNGVIFKYNDKPFNFYVRDVQVFPQDYAGILAFKPEFLADYDTVYCIDIGDGTVDMVGITGGNPDKDTIVSREFGMNKLRSQIIDDVIHDYGVTLDHKTVEAFLSGGKVALAPDVAENIKGRITQTCEQFTTDLVNQLHSKVADFRVFPTVFMGGGALALKPYLDKTKAFGITEYIDNVNANAIGYQVFANANMK